VHVCGFDNDSTWYWLALNRVSYDLSDLDVVIFRGQLGTNVDIVDNDSLLHVPARAGQ
jgi:hypothetical protein